MASDPTHEQFIYEMAAMYDGELQLVDALARLAHDTEPNTASDAFREHREETIRHADNLEQCFKLLDVAPRRVENHAVRGLALDYDAFASQSPPKDALVAFALGGAAKTEQLEIASYIGLLRQAHEFGATDIAYYLAENLRVEQITAKKVEKLADELSREHGSALGHEIDEFRWSSYTEMAAQSPLTVEPSASSMPNAADARPAPPAVSQRRPDDLRR